MNSGNKGNKTWLVAQREFMENLRTKTFWIGIIFIPILIAVSIAVPAWLEKTKDVRKYAVIDHSGWLHEAIIEAAKMPDLKLVFRSALDDLREDPEAFEELPAALKTFTKEILTPSLKELSDADEATLDKAKNELLKTGVGNVELSESFLIEALAKAVAASEDVDISALQYFPQMASAFERFQTVREEIREWWQALPPEQAKEFGSQVSKAQFELIDLPKGEPDEVLETLNQQINNEKLFAYFVIGKDPLATSTDFTYVSNNLTDNALKKHFEDYGTQVVRSLRIEEEGIDPAVAKRIQERTVFEGKKISKTGEEEEVKKEDTLRQFAPVAFVYLLWMAIFSITQMLLTNTIEEKSNRILEVLLSSISPLQLMMGKIAGIAMTGLTVVTSWVICFIVMVKYVPAMVGGKLGVDLTVIAQDPKFLASFLVYFFLGYLLLAAFLVGIGSVCNSIKEANNLMMPITVVLMVPLLAMIPISKDPNGKLAMIMSYIPPFTPFAMMNRAGGNIATWEYVVTTILLLVSIVLAMWAAAKVFRIGILMTGKAPTPMEIIRWIKTPVGHIPVQKE